MYVYSCTLVELIYMLLVVSALIIAVYIYRGIKAKSEY